MANFKEVKAVLVRHHFITVQGDSTDSRHGFDIEINVEHIILTIGRILYMRDGWEITLFRNNLSSNRWEE